jgi:hypothetical protein
MQIPQHGGKVRTFWNLTVSAQGARPACVDGANQMGGAAHSGGPQDLAGLE